MNQCEKRKRRNVTVVYKSFKSERIRVECAKCPNKQCGQYLCGHYSKQSGISFDSLSIYELLCSSVLLIALKKKSLF